jgi:hypothetical protein
VGVTDFFCVYADKEKDLIFSGQNRLERFDEGEVTSRPEPNQ